MNENPKISVIIPVFNGSNYLEQAIESVLRQTYQNFEIIVVNDGSDDNGATRKIARSFGNQIQYLEKENGGVSAALNMGIRRMSGDYFAWLSHDDLFYETKLEDQFQAILASGKETTIAQGNYFLCSEDLQTCVETRFEQFYPVEQICKSVFLLFWGEAHFSSFLFHRTHFKRVGLFNETLRFAQDNEFLFRLLRQQETVFVKQPVSKVRMHDTSGTRCFHEQVDAENRSLYLRMIKQLSEDEIRLLTGDESKLYAKIGGIVKSMGGENELDEIEKMRAKNSSESPCAIPELEELQVNSLVIFGAGEYGRRLNYELRVRGIKVTCFVDNSDKKHGHTIDGIPCYPVDYLLQHPETVVILAQKFYVSALEQVSKIKWKKLLLKEEVDSILLKT